MKNLFRRSSLFCLLLMIRLIGLLFPSCTQPWPVTARITTPEGAAISYSPQSGIGVSATIPVQAAK